MKNINIEMTLTDKSAAAALITFCLSSVVIMGMKTYTELKIKKISDVQDIEK